MLDYNTVCERMHLFLEGWDGESLLKKEGKTGTL